VIEKPDSRVQRIDLILEFAAEIFVPALQQFPQAEIYGDPASNHKRGS
jgi:hypothetical protein